MTNNEITLVEETKELMKEFINAQITALQFFWKAVAVNLDKYQKGWDKWTTVHKRSKNFKDLIDDICDAIGKMVVGKGKGHISIKTFDNYKTQIKHALIFGVEVDDANARFNTLLRAEDMVLEKLKNKDEVYVSVVGKDPAVIWAKQMSMALAGIKEEIRRQSRGKQLVPEGNSQSTAETALPNPCRYQKPHDLFSAWLEANLSWLEDNEAVSKAAEDDDPLVVACANLIGRMSLLNRNYKVREAV